jgi:hypothetical protein
LNGILVNHDANLANHPSAWRAGKNLRLDNHARSIVSNHDAVHANHRRCQIIGRLLEIWFKG